MKTVVGIVVGGGNTFMSAGKHQTVILIRGRSERKWHKFKCIFHKNTFHKSIQIEKCVCVHRSECEWIEHTEPQCILMVVKCLIVYIMG